jgi:hypothetical protein
MLNTYIDYNIFVDFIVNQPRGIIETTANFRETWNNLWKFIQSGSNLYIVNVPENYFNDIEISQHLGLLITNRSKGTINLIKNFNKPYKYTFNLDKEFQSIFFLDESNELERTKYLKNNSIPIGFKDNYLNVFSQLSLGGIKRSFTVRKHTEDKFNWDILKNYFHFISDVVIVDNYLLDNKDMAVSNLHKIIDVFNSINNVFNLTIISFVKDKEKKLQLSYEIENLRNAMQNRGVTCKLSLVLLNRDIKEHDRGIFTNYTRLKSGDSLNFLNSKGEILTKTELDFFSLTENTNFENHSIILNDLQKSIQLTPVDNKSKAITNRLLNLK